MRDEVGNGLVAPNRVALMGVTSREACVLPSLGSQCLAEIALPSMNAVLSKAEATEVQVTNQM